MLKKVRNPMSKLYIIFILGVIGIFLSFKAYGENINQKTTGSDSPAFVAKPGSTVNVNYGISEETINKMRADFWQSIMDYERQKLSDWKKKLSKLYSSETGAPAKEASEWARET